MARKVKAVPTGHSTITPFLMVKDSRECHKFCKKAFGAEVLGVMKGPGGKGVLHSALQLGTSRLFVCDATDFAPPTSANLFLYVPDADATFAAAVKAGATVVSPLVDAFWGDRWGIVQDPSGTSWQIATHIENVAPEEMARRMKEMAKERKASAKAAAKASG